MKACTRVKRRGGMSIR